MRFADSFRILAAALVPAAGFWLPLWEPADFRRRGGGWGDGLALRNHAFSALFLPDAVS